MTDHELSPDEQLAAEYVVGVLTSEERAQAERRIAAEPGFAAEVADWQERLNAEAKQSLLIVLQARDAGGKDGTVKHVMGAFNPNGVQIANFKVPTEEERGHDFLWRIHRRHHDHL